MEINTKQLEMAKRIYNNKMVEEKDKDGLVIASDEQALHKLVNEAFDANGSINKIQAYRDLNKLIVTVAETVPDPVYDQFMNTVCDYKKVGYKDVVLYNVEEKLRVNSKFTATGAGVDFTRIPSYKKKILAVPQKHQFGVKYSISDMQDDTVNTFRKAVDLVRYEKLIYTVSQIYNVTRQAVTASKIPSRQIFNASGMVFEDFRKIEASLLRYGRNLRPIIIGDQLFLNKLAELQGSEVVGSSTPKFLTDDLRESLLRDVEVNFISKSIAMAIDNPYTDRMSNEVKLPVDEAIAIAGGSESPYKVRDFGDMAILEDPVDVESEEVNLKISYKVDITLLLTRAVAYMKDTSVVL